MAEQQQETTDEMLDRVGHQFRRRAALARESGNGKGADKWGLYADVAARGSFPYDPCDPQLSLEFGQDLARAIGARRAADPSEFDRITKPTPKPTPSPTPTSTPVDDDDDDDDDFDFDDDDLDRELEEILAGD